MKKKIAAFFYYFIAARLPNSNVPFGRFFSNFRCFFLRGFLKGTGTNIIIGSNVFLGNGRDIEVGDYAQINEDSWIRNVKIGKYVMIAPRVMILNYGHITTDLKKPMMFQGVREYPQTIIEDDVWIGAGAIILPGVQIGTGSIVGAGSVLTKSIEPHSIVGGNPAKLLKRRK
jgi:maltose O-acetyltransferase